MTLYKIFFLLLSISIFSYAQNTFTSYSDMCEKSDTQECANNIEEIKNLQLAFNKDKKLNVKLDTDGKWGKNTQKAVKKFQLQHKILPAEGYVGPKTKRVLSRVYKDFKLPKIKNKKSKTGNCYASFAKNTNLKKSFKVFSNEKLLRMANGKNTRIHIDIKNQRVKLYVNNKVALSSPCTTGAKRKLEPNTRTIRDKRTPKGTFRITEKLKKKRSNIFGKYYRNGKLVYKGDRRKYRGSKKGLKFVGAALDDWMRLTSSGIGLHASKYVKRHPGSNGCIRLPKGVAKTIFAKVKQGTTVRVF